MSIKYPLRMWPLLLLFMTFCATMTAQDYVLSSPDQRLEAHIHTGDDIRVELFFEQTRMCSLGSISLVTDMGSLPGDSRSIPSARRQSVNEMIFPEIKEKYEAIENQYESLTLDFGSPGSIEFRAYDNGLAYRFYIAEDDSLIIQDESAELHFSPGDTVILQMAEDFRSSYETPYEKWAAEDIPKKKLIHLPFLIQKPGGYSLVFTESSLEGYPGMWFRREAVGSLTATAPGFPGALSYEGSPYGHGRVIRHEDYMARVSTPRSFPWRIIALASEDRELIENTLVYQLAPACRIEDASWIEPGVVAFDWWGRRNIYGVDFESGINTETAKYFIDFAAEFGFEYFLFDDGWTSNLDLFQIHPDLDMEAVMAHARKRNVKIMLWVIWATLERQMEKALDQFEEWGVAGLKIDFMNRDDQEMVRFYHRIAEEAAKRKMVIDFHGAYKPAGLRRKFPNVLTREGLIEFEYNGWTDLANPDHHNLLPYIRMVAGPMDYIPATMNNATKKNFRPVGDHPMGLGTRAHAIALWVILESPMVMLPDAPSDYYRERECTEFISRLPVEWDDLHVLHARVGAHTAVTRRHGEEWYVGAITNWTEREMEIDFSFLDEGSYHIEWIEDGVNADKRAIDYNLKNGRVGKNDVWTIHLAPGGGWVARIFR